MTRESSVLNMHLPQHNAVSHRDLSPELGLTEHLWLPESKSTSGEVHLELTWRALPCTVLCCTEILLKSLLLKSWFHETLTTAPWLFCSYPLPTMTKPFPSFSHILPSGPGNPDREPASSSPSPPHLPNLPSASHTSPGKWWMPAWLKLNYLNLSWVPWTLVCTLGLLFTDTTP